MNTEQYSSANTGRQNGGAHSSFPWSRILSKLHNVLPLPKQLELKSFCNSYGVSLDFPFLTLGIQGFVLYIYIYTCDEYSGFKTIILILTSHTNCSQEGTVVAKEIYLRQIQAIVQDDQLIRSIMLQIFS